MFQEWEKKGEAKDEAKGETKANASAVKNLMETTGWSMEKSLAALKIPEEDHHKILLLLS